jgi:hypothetical protein
VFLNNAISNKQEELSFYIVDHNELNGIGSLHKENLGQHITKEIKVSAIDFSEVIKNIKMPYIYNILIKIDVE